MTRIEFQNLYREALKRQSESLGHSEIMMESPAENSDKEMKSFSETIANAVGKVDEGQKLADKMSALVASGKSENIHETMLALTQAELSFNLMVQTRNRALEAYQEVMRMPV